MVAINNFDSFSKIAYSNRSEEPILPMVQLFQQRHNNIIYYNLPKRGFLEVRVRVYKFLHAESDRVLEGKRQVPLLA